MVFLVIMIVIFLIIGLIYTIRFDRLLEYQYKNCHESWLRSGSPRGMFFKPPGSSVLSYWLVSFKAMRDAKPDWIDEDEHALALYEKMKFWNRVIKTYAVCFLPLVIIANLI